MVYVFVVLVVWCLVGLGFLAIVGCCWGCFGNKCWVVCVKLCRLVAASVAGA